MKTTLLLSLLAFVSVPAFAAERPNTVLTAETPAPAISKEVGEAILDELRQIHALLEKQQATPKVQAAGDTVKISNAGFSMGRDDAPLTLVEFADYQCPFCRQFHTAVFARLKKEYIDTGKLRFISRDLPLEFHSSATAAASAARCAAEQNRFWPMREALISHADKLEPKDVESYAETISIDLNQFRSCTASGKYLASIQADVAEANSAGIAATPTFVLGKVSGSRIEGVRLVGAQPYETFVKLLGTGALK